MQIINISGVGFPIDAKTKMYIEEKVMKLIDYIPRHARKSASAEVIVKKNEARGANKLECTMIINLPGKRLVAKEIRDGALAAIGSAESKIIGQIRRYKAELLRAREAESLLTKAKRFLRRK
jgi:ribosomal subunit interface protein